MRAGPAGAQLPSALRRPREIDRRARRLEVVGRRRRAPDRRIAPRRRTRRLEIDPGQLCEDGGHLPQIERRIVAVLDDQIDLRLRGRRDPDPQRLGGAPARSTRTSVPLPSTTGAASVPAKRDSDTDTARNTWPGATSRIERDDRQPRAWQPNTIAAAARLARPSLERQRRWRSRRSARRPPASRAKTCAGQRNAAAVRVVPGNADVAVGAGLKGQIARSRSARPADRTACLRPGAASSARDRRCPRASAV